MRKRRIRCADLPVHAASSSTVLSRSSRRSTGYGELCEEMARWKKEPETSWLKDAPSQALQQSLKNLEDGWHRHFESLKELKAGKINPNQLVGSPRFKKNSDGNWSTRCSGLAACSSRFHRKRPASLVLWRGRQCRFWDDGRCPAYPIVLPAQRGSSEPLDQ